MLKTLYAFDPSDLGVGSGIACDPALLWWESYGWGTPPVGEALKT
ncbi:hypothetical protein [Thioalkalivibrio sp.]